LTSPRAGKRLIDTQPPLQEAVRPVPSYSRPWADSVSACIPPFRSGTHCLRYTSPRRCFLPQDLRGRTGIPSTRAVDFNPRNRLLSVPGLASGSRPASRASGGEPLGGVRESLTYLRPEPPRVSAALFFFSTPSRSSPHAHACGGLAGQIRREGVLYVRRLELLAVV